MYLALRVNCLSVLTEPTRPILPDAPQQVAWLIVVPYPNQIWR